MSKLFNFFKKKPVSETSTTPWLKINPFLGTMGVNITCLVDAPMIPVGTVANRIRFMQMDNCACNSIKLQKSDLDKQDLVLNLEYQSQCEMKYELWAVTEVIRSYITNIANRLGQTPDNNNFAFTLDITPLLTKVYQEGLKDKESWFETYASFCNNVQANIEEWAKSFGFYIEGDISALTLLV